IAFTIGLLPYGYVLWAASHHPVYSWGNVSSVHDLVRLIMRRSYGSTRLVSTPGYTGGAPWPRLRALFVSFGMLGGLLICAGAIDSSRTVFCFFCFCLLLFVFFRFFLLLTKTLTLTTAPSALFFFQLFFLLPLFPLARLIVLVVL